MRFSNVLLGLVIIGFLLYMFFEFMAANMRTNLQLTKISGDLNRILMKDKIKSGSLENTRAAQLQIDSPLSLPENKSTDQSPIDFQPTPPKRIGVLTSLYRTIRVPSTVHDPSLSEDGPVTSLYRPHTDSGSDEPVVKLDLEVARRISENLADPVLIESSA